MSNKVRELAYLDNIVLMNVQAVKFKKGEIARRMGGKMGMQIFKEGMCMK